MKINSCLRFQATHIPYLKQTVRCSMLQSLEFVWYKNSILIFYTKIQGYDSHNVRNDYKPLLDYDYKPLLDYDRKSQYFIVSMAYVFCVRKSYVHNENHSPV